MKKKLLLFDVDGTLTPSRKKIEKTIIDMLEKLYYNSNIIIGFVGGSNLEKQYEQLDSAINYFKYWFPENGLVAYENKKEFYKSNLLDFFGEEKLQSFISFVLTYIANLEIPIKRGTFFEYRTGLINISPIGRNCSQEERDNFEKYDKKHNIRETMITCLKKEFPDLDLHYSIGGQISFDVFPKGWDKSFCLNHFNLDLFEEVHFFGDKVDKGGNDYEIYIDNRVVGHKVTSPKDTLKIVEDILR